MEKYDYRKAMREDIEDYINYNVNLEDYDDRDECFEDIYDEMWVADSVTGNGSGSYFMNAYRAEEAICHNWDLLQEAHEEFGHDGYICIENGAEVADVTIRCYLLNEVLSEVLDAMWEEKE